MSNEAGAGTIRPGPLLWGLLFVVLGGCYTYVTPPARSLPLGRDVQLTLSDSGSVVLANRIGPASAAISGRLKADTATSYTLSVTSVRQRSGVEVGWAGEQLVVPGALVSGVAERRFSPTRTALFGGLAAGLFWALREALTGPGEASPAPGPGQPGTK